MTDKYTYTSPLLVPINDYLYRLMDDWYYQWEHEDVVYRVIAFRGFTCDIASVPRFFWSWGFLPDGLHRGAAVIHDLLCRYRGAPTTPDGLYQKAVDGLWVDVPVVLSRKDCDRLFCRIMREAGTSKLKANLMFLAVRAWGAFHNF